MESERRRRGRKAKAEKRSPDLEKGNQTVCKSKNKKQSGEKEDKPEPALLRKKKSLLQPCPLLCCPSHCSLNSHDLCQFFKSYFVLFESGSKDGLQSIPEVVCSIFGLYDYFSVEFS